MIEQIEQFLIAGDKDLVEQLFIGQPFLKEQIELKFKPLLNLTGLNIFELFGLEELFLGYNQIKEIPKEIGLLTNLVGLDLYNNKIVEIPKEIGLLTNLQWLDLSNNQIVEIPKEIGCLTNLEIFNLRDNQIKEIPKELEHLNIII